MHPLSGRRHMVFLTRYSRGRQAPLTSLCSPLFSERRRIRRRTMAAPSKKAFEVFVSKIPWTTAGKEMREYFGQFGPVKKCLLPFDKDTGFHRGFCWVGFTTEEGLNNALQKDPHMLEGAKLQVQRNRRPFAGQRSNRDGEHD